jgi:hypothetical protein
VTNDYGGLRRVLPGDHNTQSERKRKKWRRGGGEIQGVTFSPNLSGDAVEKKRSKHSTNGDGGA